MECLTRSLRQEIVKNEEKIEKDCLNKKKERRERGGERMEDDDDNEAVRTATEESYIAAIGEEKIVELTSTLKDYNECTNPRVKGPTAVFPQYIQMDDNINEEDNEEAVEVLERSNENKDNNVDALELEEDREMGDVEEVHVNKHMTDGAQLAEAPDEVRLCNLKEMIEEAYKLIPDIGQESMSLDEDDKDSRSIKLEDTQELMEKIQQQSRHLVAFDNYVDANKSLDNDNDAEDDEYMLKILHEKRLESTLEFSADGSSVFAPIGVFAEYGEVAPSRFVGRKRTNEE
ncbi:hypothetical protein ACA910_007886 [Epithemia clementina (nom. ined.)]